MKSESSSEMLSFSLSPLPSSSLFSTASFLGFRRTGMGGIFLNLDLRLADGAAEEEESAAAGGGSCMASSA